MIDTYLLEQLTAVYECDTLSAASEKGYAAEALRAVLEYLTSQEGIACVTAWCASDNIASKRTLEKAAMRLMGIDAGGLEVDGQRYDKLDYTYSDQESE